MLETLRRIVQEVSDASTLAEALSVMVERVREAIDAEACSIFVRDKKRGDYLLMATDGLNADCVGKLRLTKEDGLVGYIIKRGEPINLENATLHPQFKKIPEVGEDRYKAFLGVPIIHQRETQGVLIVQQQEARKFDEAEEAFLVTLSAQIAAVIAHAEVSGMMLRSTSSFTAGQEVILKGIAGAEGIAIGVGVVVYPPADLEAVPERKAKNPEEEVLAFETALDAARIEIRHLGDRLSAHLPPEERALFDVYEKILDRASFGSEVIKIIRDEGKWAQWALCQVINRHIRQFEKMDDAYLRERAEDIEDLGKRVLSHLQRKQAKITDYPLHTILVGEVITAANIAEVPEKKLVGIISGRGSGNSHVAILARALGIPTVMGVERLIVTQLDGREAIVDGYYGQIYVTPTAILKKEFSLIASEARALDADLAELRDLPAQTPDGHHVSLSVNTGLAADLSRALSVGADGVGLYRTEIPFMLRDRFPSEKEQRAIYQQLLAAFAPRPVIMRTLDVGGDKPLPYMQLEEENPFLGWRGIRITLDHPEIFLVQLRAMLSANAQYQNLRILLPMVTTVSEVTEAKLLLQQAYQELIEEGVAATLPPLGVMIEVPSAVYQTRLLAQRVDFLSVGSNDLTQYLLAVDRNNPRVSALYDSLHPAVLKALNYIVESCHKEGKVVSLCGEMAGDPVAVIMLLAMGFDSLSMSGSNLPRTKWLIRKLPLKRARELFEEVMSFEEPAMIRKYLENALEKMNLGSLVRAGRK